MIRYENSIEFDLAQRQVVMKDSHHKSLFVFIREILDTYGLPSVFWLLDNRPSKEEWKGMLNHKIHESVEALWKSDISSKSSTKYVNPDALKVGSHHHIWSTVRNNVHDSKRAQLKCKLLTGSYILQANRAAFNQYTVNPSCKLCSSAPETRQHFIGECVFFDADRKFYIGKLQLNPALSNVKISQFQDPEFLTQLTLDASALINFENIDKEQLGSLELCTREYIHRIHVRRIRELKRIA